MELCLPSQDTAQLQSHMLYGSNVFGKTTTSFEQLTVNYSNPSKATVHSSVCISHWQPVQLLPTVPVILSGESAFGSQHWRQPQAPGVEGWFVRTVTEEPDIHQILQGPAPWHQAMPRRSSPTNWFL